MQLKRSRKRSQASKIALLSTLALNLSLYLSHWLALSLSVVGCNLLRPILPLCVITLLPFSLHYFAFIRGNFVLLLAARQHPSAYVCVSFGALSAISSLTLYFSLSLSVSASLWLTSAMATLRFSWLSNKARMCHPKQESESEEIGPQCRLFASSDLVCAHLFVYVHVYANVYLSMYLCVWSRQ